MIYKPNSCKPFLDTTDINEKPFYLSCYIDSSNIAVNGYTIKVYDADNNQIFPHNPITTLTIDKISFVSDLQTYVGDKKINTGLNGSLLKIPFIVGMAGDTSTSVNRNQLYADDNIIKDANGNQYQDVLYNGCSYKWVITLYELVKDSAGNYQIPTEVKYFDMILTTGTVLGSNYKRIQSIKSNKIFKDYYIQLGSSTISKADKYEERKASNFIAVGVRAQIDSYDQTFGYIYPVTGDSGFQETDVSPESVNSFKIYKNGNDYSSLADTNKVQYVQIGDFFGNFASSWTPSINTPGNSYATVIYYTNLTGFYPLDIEKSGSRLVQKSETIHDCEDRKTRIAFVGNAPKLGENGFDIKDEQKIKFGNGYLQSFTDSDGSKTVTHSSKSDPSVLQYKPSPYNGIFIPRRSVEKSTVSGYEYKVTVSWYRAPDADAIGDLMNRTVCVAPGSDTYAGKNITFIVPSPKSTIINYNGDKIENVDYTDIVLNQLGGSIGVINTDAKGEYTDEAIEQSVEIADGVSTGVIFYNEEPTSTKKGHMFLRPFVGLKSGMWWQELDSTKRQEAQAHYILGDTNTEYWYTRYEQLEDSPTVPHATDKTRYQIRSYFKDSDENPFSFYTKPKINCTIASVSTPDDPYEMKSGVYIIDDSRNIICSVSYEQEQNISWQSYQWILYDEEGNTVGNSGVVYDGEIKYTFYGLRGKENGVPYNYDLQLIIDNYKGYTVTKNYKLSTTFPEDGDSDATVQMGFDCDMTAARLDMAPIGVVKPDQTDLTIDGGVLKLTKDVDYHKVAPTKNDSAVSAVELKDLDSTEVIRINSHHKLTDDNFVGDFFKISDTDSPSNYFKVIIPEMTTPDGELNEDRNKIVYEWQNEKSSGTGHVKLVGTITSDDGEWYPIDESKKYMSTWRSKSFDPSSYRDSVNYINNFKYVVYPVGTGNPEYGNINGLTNIYSTKTSASVATIHEPLYGASELCDNWNFNGSSLTTADSKVYAYSGTFSPTMMTDHECTVETIYEGYIGTSGQSPVKTNVFDLSEYYVWPASTDEYNKRWEDGIGIKKGTLVGPFIYGEIYMGDDPDPVQEEEFDVPDLLDTAPWNEQQCIDENNVERNSRNLEMTFDIEIDQDFKPTGVAMKAWTARNSTTMDLKVTDNEQVEWNTVTGSVGYNFYIDDVEDNKFIGQAVTTNVPLDLVLPGSGFLPNEVANVSEEGQE